MATRPPVKPTPQNGFAIREIREREGLSVSDLANAIGVTDPHLRNIENEHKPASAVHMARIAKKLRCRPAAIARGVVQAVEDVA